MTRTPKPVTIPKDLKPGAILTDVNGAKHIVVFYDRCDAGATPCVCCSDGTAWRLDNGARIIGTNERIIRIERIASKPTKRARKVDIGVGAECILLVKRIARECAERQNHKARKLPNHLWQQVRSIARRLNNGAKP